MSFETLNKKGSIVVITLVIMLVMTTMGAGFYYSTLKTVNSALVEENAVQNLYSSESCITEAVAWLNKHSKNGPPAQCLNKSSSKSCAKINGNQKGWSPKIGERVDQSRKMEKQSYSCEIYPLGNEALTSSSGSGFDVGESGAYDQGIGQTKYYYKIKSYSSKASVEVVVSSIL